MTKQHDLVTVTDEIWSELEANTSDISNALFRDPPLPDSQKMRHGQVLDIVRRNWPDPAYRKALIDRLAPVGPFGQRHPEAVKSFLQLVNDALAPVEGVDNAI